MVYKLLILLCGLSTSLNSYGAETDKTGAEISRYTQPIEINVTPESKLTETRTSLPASSETQSPEVNSAQATNSSISTGSTAKLADSDSHSIPKQTASSNWDQLKTGLKSCFGKIWQFFHKLSNLIQDYLRSDNLSQPARLVVVFLLGLLMSLTPCIYPVIPLTVGALQSQKSRSLSFSFLLSLAYAIGLSLTFATMGLTAAISGQLFGSLAQHPLLITLIVAQLLYMAGAMFGWYEIYIPKFLQVSHKTPRAGSFISAFTFGLISGTVASPCLSPGLALLLTIVATLANKFLGFILLFTFGLGLSTPLVLIGTFSSALNFLPRAGKWMLTVKKLFGWLLLGMSLYFLNNLIPFSTYLSNSIYPAPTELPEIPTYTNYQDAREFALTDHKKLLIDVGADWCTLCKRLDKRLFHNAQLLEPLSNFVILKVNATDPQSEPYASLRVQYNIIGVPTVLIIDPLNEQLLARYDSNLLAKTDTELRQIVQSLN